MKYDSVPRIAKYGRIKMKKTISKTLIISSIFLCSSLTGAQETAPPIYDIDQGDPDTCQPFPSCALDTYLLNLDSQEEQSEWSKFWEELTKEMKEKAQLILLQSE